jgi:hypothetical protein
MIIALAGRRVDGADAKESRFPQGNVEMVRMRAHAALKENGATMLVSSAACGADLLALSEAGQLAIRRRVILPFDRKRFRETSVTDRPGEWGPLYDQVLDEVEAAGDLVILQNGLEDEAYAAANHAILDEALGLAKAAQEPVMAVLMWDGVSRGHHDLTEEFGAEALQRGLQVAEVRTI